MKILDKILGREKRDYYTTGPPDEPLVSKELVRENIVNIPQFEIPDGVMMRQEPRVYASSCDPGPMWSYRTEETYHKVDRTLPNFLTRCRYCGAKHTSEERECCKCGAPL